MGLSNLFSILKGGAGSGNIGHAGILGHRGGSAPSRVWSGQIVEYDGPQLSKSEVGAIGEKLAMKVLSEKFGTKFTTLNVNVNNAPLDAGGDHMGVEIKTGLASNGSTAQHFRATIGQPGKAEASLIAKMTHDEKREHNQYKEQKILERKQRLLDELSKESGTEIKGSTVGIILSPDGKRGDLYLIPGFHLRTKWSDLDKYEFLGTHEV